MSIRIDVLASVQEAQVAREADKLADQFDAAGQKSSERWAKKFTDGITRATPQIQRAFNGLETAMARVSDEKAKLDAMSNSGASSERMAAQAEKVTRAMRSQADAYRSAGAAISSYSAKSDRDVEASARIRLKAANDHRKGLEDEAKDAERAAARLGNSAMSITDQLADMGRTAGMAFRGTAMIGAPIILMDIAGAVGALAGVLGPLTAGLGAAAVGFGTLKLGMNGFGDAMSNIRDTEKFNQSLASLAPSAQNAAVSLRNMLPEFDALQRATQQSLFAGVGPQLDKFLGDMLPTVQQTTTGVAAAFNQMFMNITNEMSSSGTMGSIQEFANNTVAAFQQLAPAVAPLGAALADIMAVGSGFLPILAGQISELAQEFGNWIREAKDDGSMAEWMGRGINAAEALLSVLDDAAKMFDSLGDRGMGAIDKIVAGFQLISSTVRILNGDLGALGDMMPAFGEMFLEPFHKVASVINASINSINFLIRGMNSVTGTKIPEVPQLNPIEDVAGGRPMFGGPVWLDHGPTPNAQGPGAISPTRGENRTSRPGGVHTAFPAPDGSGWNGGNPSTFPGGVGAGGRIAGTGTWQSPFAPGQGGINGVGGRGGSKFKGKDWAAPADQWSLDNVPIGSFPGVPGPGSVPNMGGPQIGPVDPQQMWDAQSRSESAKFRVEETRQRFLELAHDNTTSETDLLKAKHDVSEAERDFISAEMKSAEVARGKLQSMSKGMKDVGAALDADLGLSDGLPGLAKNLAAFMGNLATAPLRAQLQATSDTAAAQGQPTGGFGILGIRGAQNMMSGLSPLLGRPVTDGTGYQGTSSAYGATTSAYAPGAGYPGDAALLANAPKGIGQYDNTTKDLSKGLVDCASGVEDLVNILDGKPTAGGSLWTGNASTVLPGMGFKPGMGGPGDFRVGYNAGHMQATLPGGTNVNFGSTPAIQAGGQDGGQGAYDPAFTSHYYRPTAPAVAPAGGNYGGAGAAVPPANGGGSILGSLLDQFTGGGGQGPILKKSPGFDTRNPPPTPPGATSWQLKNGQWYPSDHKGNIVGPAYGSGSPASPPLSPRGGMLDVSGQRTLDTETGLTKAPGDVGFSTGMRPPLAPNIGPGPLQVGPPGVPGGGGAPGSIGPFPTPAGMGLPGGVGPNLPGATAGGTPAGTSPSGTHIGALAGQPGVAMGGTGGVGVSGGLMDAAMMAAGGLDLLAPGAGQAAQIGIKLANRAVEYGSQLAGIGVSGLMETFLPTGGSELANGGWIPRIAGGIAGAKPALPNIAGGKGGQEPPPPLDPNQVQQQGMTAPAGQGPNVGVTINNNNATPDQNMRQADWHAQQMYQGASR